MSLRALHVIPAVAPRYGGPSHAVVAMCRALAEAGVDATIATTDADGAGRLDVPLGETTEWHGVPAVFFRRDASESFKYSRGLGRWLRGHVPGFDVVHVHAVLSYAPIAAAAAARKAGVPYVVRPLGTLAVWSLGQRSLRKRALLALAASRMLHGAAAIQYTSRAEWRDAEAALRLSRGVVIPLGTDAALLDAPPAPLDGPEPYVLALARLHPKKNLGPLIEGFLDATDSADRRAWRLIVAGDGDPGYVAALEQAAAGRGAGRVRLEGWVEGERKRGLIAGASLFALPSLQENFGLSLVEALAAGVPALVSARVDLAADVEAAGAGWIAGTSRGELAAALADATASLEERRRRGLAARELARRFSWPAIARDLASLYARLAARPAAATGDPVKLAVS